MPKWALLCFLQPNGRGYTDGLEPVGEVKDCVKCFSRLNKCLFRLGFGPNCQSLTPRSVKREFRVLLARSVSLMILMSFQNFNTPEHTGQQSPNPYCLMNIKTNLRTILTYIKRKFSFLVWNKGTNSINKNISCCLNKSN